MIEIWNPRWHDRKVLIAKYKVTNDNKIVFTKAKSLAGKVYSMTGDEISQYPIETNGTISCYVVPLDEVQKNELQEQE